MEKLINREQLAGMNIHYLFYSLEYFLDAQKEAGFKTIELWPGTPHFFLHTNISSLHRKKSSLKKVWHILRKLWMPVKNWV